MSIESYILGLQKNPSPGKIGKIVLGGLTLMDVAAPEAKRISASFMISSARP